MAESILDPLSLPSQTGGIRLAESSVAHSPGRRNVLNYRAGEVIQVE